MSRPGNGVTRFANRKIHGTTGEVPFERLAEEQRLSATSSD